MTREAVKGLIVQYPQLPGKRSPVSDSAIAYKTISYFRQFKNPPSRKSENLTICQGELKKSEITLRCLLSFEVCKLLITVAGFKGGIGKTTTAVHLACYFSQLGKTLLVDGDPNRSATGWSKQGNQN